MSSDSKWKKLWESGKLISCKVPELKDYLRGVGLPMSGDTSAIVKRVTMHLDVKFLDLFVLQDGAQTSPFDLKQPQLRRIVAQLGMDPSGDKDELHFSLIEHLKKKSTSKTSSGTDDSAAGSSITGEPRGVLIAKQILEMSDDYPAILSASGANITTDSSVGKMRAAYLKLSLLIHPDKLQKEFPEATKAFQCLVNAYERLSQPELFLEEEAEDKKKKDKKISRSNDGCHRTRVFCPRCKAEWGLPDSGTADYDYNFLMMGLRTFNCAGCLFEFGCMTAIHKCPGCRKEFLYHPNDFHRKVLCGNEGCKKQFGFFIFHISDRMEKEYRAAIRVKQEKRLKEKEQLEDRARRAKSRTVDMGPQGKAKLFLLNLLDECPRCGEEIESNHDIRSEHVANCKDKSKIAAHARKLKEQSEVAAKKAKMQEMQDEVQNVHSWEYLGGKTTDMWLLTEKQLKAMCENYKLDSEGTKDELIARVVHYRNALDSKRMITGGEEGKSGNPGKKSFSAADLPTNMENMSVAQLKAVCASFGITTAPKTKAGIINEIEKLCLGSQPFLQLTDGKKK